MRCANCKKLKYCDNSVTPPNTPAHKNKFPYYDIIAAEYLIWIWWCRFQSLPTLIFRPSPPSWSSPAAAYALCAIMYGRWVGGGIHTGAPTFHGTELYCAAICLTFLHHWCFQMALNYTLLPCAALKCIRQYGWPPLHCIHDDDPDANLDDDDDPT